MNRITVEEMIRNTDSLTFLNAFKTAISELKEELAQIEEQREYQNQAIERARKVMRRIDNQYRAIVKSTHKLYTPPEVQVDTAVVMQQIEEEVAAEDE